MPLTPEEEFRAALARAGLPPPAEREDLMVQAWLGYRELASLLWTSPLPASAEPEGLVVPSPAGSAR